METFRALLGLPPGASSFADGIDLLHLFVISVTMAISLYVFASAAWFTIRYARKANATTTTTSAPTTAKPRIGRKKREAILISGVLGMFLLWWVIGYVQFTRIADPPDDAMTIVVTAKQWMWQFTYPDGRETNDILTVPEGRNVRLVMTSRDVIHSFYVPQFRLKHDVIPGRYVTAWFRATKTGDFDIFCAEYCGVSHSRMLGRVVVLSPGDYERWLGGPRASNPREDEEIVRRGISIATRHGCMSCHTLDGQSHVGPTWSHLYGSSRKTTDGRLLVADESYLTRSMMEPNEDIVAGYRPVMPAYVGQLSPGEVGALVELIRALQHTSITGPPALPKLEVRPVDAGYPHEEEEERDQ